MTIPGLFELTGKVVFATGGNSGIGLAFHTGCARQGADVISWDRDAARHDEVLAALKAAGAGRTHAETADVADEAKVEGAFTATLAAMGRVDCVLANAGFNARAPSFPDMTSAAWHALLAVNPPARCRTSRARAAYLASDASKFHTGDNLVIDGGRIVKSL